MNNVWVIIQREFLERVRSKWFIIGTLGVPLFLILVFAIPIYFETRNNEAERAVVVVDETGQLGTTVAEGLRQAGWNPEVTTQGLPVDTMEARVARGAVSGYLVLDAETLESGRTVFRAEDGPSTLRSIAIRQSVSRAVMDVRFEGEASELRRILQGGELVVERVGGESEIDEDRRRLGLVLGFGGAFLLYFVLLLHGVAVMRSVVEEKSGRIVEVLVSAVKPWQLMLGKIIGVGAVGLTQMIIWVGTGVAAATFGLPALIAAQPGMEGLSVIREALPGIGMAVFYVVLFILGYFLYASAYAAVGAMCSSEEEIQQAQFPVTMMLVIPAILMPALIENPQSSLATWTSLFPFFSPILMFPRVVSGAAPLWQIAVSLAGIVVAIFVVAWLAGKIYRVGILMQGKRPTLPEMLRWLRQSA